MMNNDFEEILLGLPEPSQIRLLGHIALELTIFARSAYRSDGISADSNLLRKINELQHRLSDRIVHLCDRRETYPVDVFASMIVAGAEEIGFKKILERVIRTALTT